KRAQAPQRRSIVSRNPPRFCEVSVLFRRTGGNAMSEPVSGSCLCGAIRFTVSAPVGELRACHCTHCQKTSGGAGSVNVVMPSSALQITKGTPKRYAAKADSGRTLYRFF